MLVVLVGVMHRLVLLRTYPLRQEVQDLKVVHVGHMYGHFLQEDVMLSA